MPRLSRNYLYATTHDGRRIVQEGAQHDLLHAQGLPHTHVYRSHLTGKEYRKRWYPARGFKPKPYPR